MGRQENIQSTLDKFGKYLVQQSKANLTRMGKNSSKGLYESINYKASVAKEGKSFSFQFNMEQYGEFQDKGVRGAKSRYPESQNSPFAYRDKKPPASAFSAWAVRKGLEGVRDPKTGRFKSRKSLQYALAQSIFNKGIRATNFFSKPFGVAFEKLPTEIINAFLLDQKSFEEFIKKE
jgi:hypothetical protein